MGLALENKGEIKSRLIPGRGVVLSLTVQLTTFHDIHELSISSYDHDMPFSFTFKLSVPGLSNPFSTGKAPPYHSPGRPTPGSILIDTPAALNPPRRYPQRSSVSKSPPISRKRGWEPAFTQSTPTPPTPRYHQAIEDSYQEVMASDTGGFHNAPFVFHIPSLPSREDIHTTYTCFSVYHPFPRLISSIYHHLIPSLHILCSQPLSFKSTHSTVSSSSFTQKCHPRPSAAAASQAASSTPLSMLPLSALLSGSPCTVCKSTLCPTHTPLSNHPTFSWRDRGKGPERLPPPPPYQEGEWISEQDKHQRQAASHVSVPTSPPPPISPPPIHVIPTTPRNHRKARHVPGVSSSAGKRSIAHRRTVQRGTISHHPVVHHHQPALSSTSALFPPPQPEFNFEPVDVDDEVCRLLVCFSFFLRVGHHRWTGLVTNFQS